MEESFLKNRGYYIVKIMKNWLLVDWMLWFYILFVYSIIDVNRYYNYVYDVVCFVKIFIDSLDILIYMQLYVIKFDYYLNQVFIVVNICMIFGFLKCNKKLMIQFFIVIQVFLYQLNFKNKG